MGNKGTEIATTDQAAGELVTYSDAARKYARASKADSTLKAYGADWRAFVAWCEARGLASLPAQPLTVVEYLAALADCGRKLPTIEQHRAAIAFAHRAAGHVDPAQAADVHTVMQGIARTIGRAQAKAYALTVDDVRALVRALPDSLAGQRDRALILVGFFGALRRSELVYLDSGDVRFNGALHITLRRSKTDQTGKGHEVTLPRLVDAELDPFRALRAWLDSAEIADGPIFRPVDKWGHARAARMSAQSVRLVLQAAAERAGFDPEHVADMSGHSLRRGFATSADAAGVDLRGIMAVTRHKSVSVAMGYIADDERAAGRAIRTVAGEAR